MDLRSALTLAHSLLQEHGLHDWTVTLDRAKTRAGACRYGLRQVSLSAPLTMLHSEAEVRDTILHEIAHALVGPSHRHDALWRATALRIGSTGERCVPSEAPRVRGDWVGLCPAGHERHRHRRPRRPQSCAHCSPVFDPRHLLSWTYRGRVVPLGEAYEAQLAALTARAGEGEAATGPQLSAPLALGDPARCLAPGKYYGVVGQVVKRGRSRYHLRVPAGVLTVPFALVEAA
jgi:predicted SprT family Zn-dependent metalloprotease